jgi:hypothetical protein
MTRRSNVYACHRNGRASVGDLDELVRVRTWQGGCFEFAHFTLPQLADALIAVHRWHGGRDREQLVTDLTRHRDNGQDIKHVWSSWGSEPSKVHLARKLRPALEATILQALEDPAVALPQIAQVVLDADHLARSRPLGEFVLSTKPKQRGT